MSDRAPSFELHGEDGTTTSLAGLAGRWVVLYFYPKDDTPGCTRQALAFSAAAKELAKRGATVVGISRDSLERHATFRSKYDLKIELLSDPDAKVHHAYGAFGEKKLYGKTVLGVIRSTFLIDPKGTIAKRYANVKVDGHVDAVLNDLDAFAGAAGGGAAPGHAEKAPAKKPAAAAAKRVRKKS